MSSDSLSPRLAELGAKAKLAQLSLAYLDLESGERFSYQGGEVLHAASTFKVAVLLALLRAAAEGVVDLEDQLQVRNRFRSVVDGSPYFLEGERDGDAEVYRQIGRSASLRRLARAMIVRSSNLATNLLLDFLSVERVCGTLAAARVEGVLVRRGVEDLLAHEQGINNEAIAEGLVSLMTIFAQSDFLPERLRVDGLCILLAQEFNSMIPARLPAGVMVAHKTGEISTHAHDAGIVFPANRLPYVLAVMTSSEAGGSSRQKAVADASQLVFQHLTEARS